MSLACDAGGSACGWAQREELVLFSQGLICLCFTGTRRSKKAAGGGGAGRTAAIVLMVVLLVVVVALAIALPVVFTRRMQQNAANAAAATAGRSASDPGTGAAGAGAGAAAGVNGASASGTPAGLPVAGATPGDPASVPGVAGSGVLAPVGPNLNTGDDVFCYKSATTGEVLPGAFRKTGVKATDDGLARSEVRSCGSGSTLFLLDSQLVSCQQPCLTPVWLAVQNGLIQAPIWTQQYVCRGDQVYENRMSSRYTFYWRFAGFVEEQLITRCDSNDAWWVPNIELSYCTTPMQTSCQVSNLNRATPKGVPVLVPGLPAGTSQTPRTVCRSRLNKEGVRVVRPSWATGAVTNSFVFTRMRFMDQVEVVPCSDRAKAPRWIYVDDIVPCADGVADTCAAGATAVSSTTTIATTTGSAAVASAAPSA